MIKKKTIIIAAGASGGHIFPALSLAEGLILTNDIIFITDNKFDQFVSKNHNLFKNSNFYIKKLKTKNPKYFKLIKQIFTILIDIFYTLFIMLKYKTHACIGFGSRVSLISIIASRLLYKKTFLHEQNAVMGLANRISAPLCNKCFLGFENTKLIPKFVKNKVIFTGTPIRKDFKYQNKTKQKDNIFRILIIGGSQGAKIFKELAKLIDTSIIGTNIKITQQARLEDIDFIKTEYNNKKINCEISNFFFDIQRKMLQGDMIISRAGASIINEILELQIPNILIPMKNSANNHQFYNAQELNKQNLAILLEEKNIEKINEKIDQIRNKKIKFEFNGKNFNNLKENLLKYINC